MTDPRACPSCGRPAAPRARNRASPFCSDRCKLLDLGKWLDERYRIPGPRAGDMATGGEGEGGPGGGRAEPPAGPRGRHAPPGKDEP
ncbi:MAG TPA: DNA gyrase inhibitor YacG [Anaeromyxobacteraceae bacterium]|nr:DNA gyrase inhibitor YacG [Anaeromyxobacteraceae bacterium]